MKKLPFLLFVLCLSVFIMGGCADDPVEPTPTPTPTPTDTTKTDTPTVDPTPAAVVGWPANYDGVMLQGFYWDGYGDAQWTRLASQADDLAPYFSLVWIPQSGNCGQQSMGYDDLYWFTNYNSSFGTEQELRTLIQTFKAKGIGTIADVVINHRKSLTTWNDFPSETYNGVTYSMTYEDICADDEAARNGYQVGKNYDTGEAWDGMRDLDHKSQNVQTIVKAYLDFLLKDLGYTGFRYDMVKGYSGSFTKLYNESSKPQFSVGECWDGTNTIKNWIEATGRTSAAFDFQFRYTVRNAVNNGSWNRLGLQNDGNWPLVSSNYNNGLYRQWAVTFVENHDTEYRSATASQDPIRKDTLAANAYLLASPGTPCVFLKHWKAYKYDIARMIQARQLCGIQNTSAMSHIRSNNSFYAATTKGAKGTLLVWLGEQSADSEATAGYTRILAGPHYSYWIENSLVAAWKALAEPTFKEDKIEKHDITIYLKDPGWSQVYFYAWDGNQYLDDAWPGKQVTATKNINGTKYYYRTFNVSAEASYSMNVIFDQGSSEAQTVNIEGITSDRYYEIGDKNTEGKYTYKDITNEIGK